MKILMITATVPFPPMEGYSLRCINVARELARHNEVHLLAVDLPGREVDLHHPMNPFRSVTVVPIANAPMRTAFRALLHREPYHVHRYTNDALTAKLRELLDNQRFDVVYSNFIYFSGAIAAAAGADRPLLVLDQHNLDRDMWHQKSEMESSALKRFASRLNLAATKAYEDRFYPMYDLVVSVSERDSKGARAISAHPEIMVAPNGVDTARFDSAHLPRARSGSTILFVGSNVHMNIQAIHWFAREIFPLVRARVPESEFHVVGNIPRDAISEVLTLPGVHFWGRVPDVTTHFLSARLFVAPFRVGAGSKLKVLEAFAAKCPLVATDAGIVGIDGAAAGKHYEYASTSESFADLCIRLLQENDRADSLAVAARELAETVYDWQHIGVKVNASISQLVERKHRGQGA